jgi:Fur family ferric uptake transcriptional regulator
MAQVGSTEAVPKITPQPPHGCALLMMDLFRIYLHQRHLPVTRQREAVAMTLFESDQHLSVEEVAQRLRAKGEHVGMATVYRTLNLLVEAGLAHEHDFGEGFKRYEHRAGEARHDHLICTGCGKVVEFARPAVDDLQREIAREAGFEPQTRRFEIYGLCPDCRAGRAAEAR